MKRNGVFRSCLVTGASGAIGYAISIMLMEKGYDLFLTCQSDLDRLKHIKSLSSLNKQIVNCSCYDFKDANQVLALTRDVKQVFGGVDIIINTAVARNKMTLETADLGIWNQSIAVNLTAPMLICSELIGPMVTNGYGRIINFSGIAASLGHGLDKSTVKSGIVGLTRSIAFEYGKFEITANCIAPGLTESGKNVDLSKPCAPSPDQPIKRLALPSEILHAVDYLIDEKSSFVTGQVLHVNGGRVFT